MSGASHICLIPPIDAGDDASSAALRWWLVGGGEVSERLHRPDGDAPVIALVPARDCPVQWVTLPGLAPRQAAAAARLQIAGGALGDDNHIVAGVAADANGAVAVAAVSVTAMKNWQTVLAAHGVVPAAMVPVVLLLPMPADGQATALRIGGGRIARRGDRAFAVDPALDGFLLSDCAIAEVAGPALSQRLSAITANPGINLLAGPFAPPRASVFGKERLWTAALLVGLVVLVSLSIGLIRLTRLHADSARIDDASIAAAATVLGRTPDPKAAIADLDAQLAAIGSAQGNAASIIAALMQAMEAQPGVALDNASWDAAGTLTATLGAARAEDINPVLLALQAGRYRITAQPRTGSDGRALGDITIRSEP